MVFKEIPTDHSFAVEGLFLSVGKVGFVKLVVSFY
jgi:hypothetical protein